MCLRAQLGPAVVPHRLKEMSAELQELQGKVAPGRAEPATSDSPRIFNFEDKRRLSQHLGALPGDKYVSSYFRLLCLSMDPSLCLSN